MARHYAEQKNTQCEHISLFPVVELAPPNFWSHVALGPSVFRELFDIHASGEAKVYQFNVHVLVDQYILWFDVSVDHPCLMDVVQSVHQLSENKPTIRLTDAIALVKLVLEREKGFTGRVLHDNIGQVLDDSAACLHQSAIGSFVENLYTYFMVKAFHDADLALESLLGLSALSDVVRLDNFDCHLLVRALIVG